MIRLLLLGGTSEGTAIARHLGGHPGVQVISSLAGRVVSPNLPAGEVRIGGFGGITGLIDYLVAERIDGVIDATHPFAAQISIHAAAACAEVSVPLLAFVRLPWMAIAGDDWRPVADAAAAARLCTGRVFLTVGRQEVEEFAQADAWFLIRAIDPPTGILPPRRQLLLARGPFDVDDEIALMRRHRIGMVVSKNSGGSATYAKLVAARSLGLPVVMIERPPRPLTDQADSLAAVDAWLDRLVQTP
jgi:precorrin-6A/cobalt-precorrin-6A reductase